MTIKEHIDAAIENLDLLRARYPGPGARHFSLAITALEDAGMRATCGIAVTTGVHRPVDLQRQLDFDQADSNHKENTPA